MADGLSDLWLIVPTKPFAEGKARLSAILSAGQRHALNRRFFRHTMDVVLQVFRKDRIIVVSRSEEVLNIATVMGAKPLAEAGPGDLIAALDQATMQSLRDGAKDVFALSCDLPLLAISDIHAMIATCSARPCVVIAGDRKENGTNALLLAPAAAIAYRYGDGSFEAHASEARQAGIEPGIVRRHGLAFDVDTPADLEKLLCEHPDWIA